MADVMDIKVSLKSTFANKYPVAQDWYDPCEVCRTAQKKPTSEQSKSRNINF